MLTCFKLVRNVGQFDSVPAPAVQPVGFGKLTLIYAENGRGKTTLAAMLRSLATGNARHVQERSRLGAQHPPHIVLERLGAGQPIVFQNGAWSQTHDGIVIYDDTFVDENVYSGLEVGSDHKQRLHELIVGEKGVALAKQLDTLAQTVLDLNKDIRGKGNAIPQDARVTMTADAFCALTDRPDIDAAIHSAEQTLAAVTQAEPVRKTPALPTIGMPAVDFAGIEAALGRDLPDLNAVALEKVRQHLTSLGDGGEAWVSQGAALADRLAKAAMDAICPFCAQSLAGSSLIQHYQAYFSQAYTHLKDEIAARLAELETLLGGDGLAAFERAAATLERLRGFWGKLCDVPATAIDPAAAASAWAEVRDALRKALAAKQASPLEPLALDEDMKSKIAAYQAAAAAVSAASNALQAANTSIAAVKQRVAATNATAAAADLARLKAVKARFSPAVASLCREYLDLVVLKETTEARKQKARQDLDQYRASVFPAYEVAINRYLSKFNAGFALAEVKPANPMGRASSNYAIKINNVVVPLSAAAPGQPSFKTTLSAGDRNALALAFFFACLDHDPKLRSRVVVIDDPISSLDDGRTVRAAQAIRDLTAKAKQVIVLSHSKRFLCNIWEETGKVDRKAIEVSRSGTGSDLVEWRVDDDCATQYDRNHEALRQYRDSGAGDRQQVAQTIRPVLEGFLRVACPEHMKPGTLLGRFENFAQQRLGQVDEILDAGRLQALRDITTYANQFHHDTNPAWQTIAINDQELAGFVRTTLDFVRA